MIDYERQRARMRKPRVGSLAWIEYWGNMIELAQEVTHYRIEGVLYERRPYASDVCHECGVRYGQFHVPDCAMERCPRCGGGVQLISCHCEVSGL